MRPIRVGSRFVVSRDFCPKYKDVILERTGYGESCSSSSWYLSPEEARAIAHALLKMAGPAPKGKGKVKP